MKYLIALLSFAAFLILLFFISQKSGFTNFILNDNYTNKGCSSENRVYPSGNVPGSYLGLTEAEKNGLLKDFIMNDKNKLNVT